MTFIVRSLRFRFVAQDPLFFPAHKPGNILRGAFGLILRDVAGPRDYARLFEPEPLTNGPSGLANLPRPFVFRAAHLDGRHINSGEHFDFGVNLFTKDPWPVPHFEAAFRQLAIHGLGPGRGKATLISLGQETLELPLTPTPAETVTVEFVTPTDLKGADTPHFPILMARLRDRIANLSAHYGNGPLDIDFRGLAAQTGAIALVTADLHKVDAQRTSSRTGQTHPLSGFVGSATYSGNLTPFMPYLEIGQHTGVGRQTVWGKGELKLLVP
jgi:hypothetical protein